MSTTMIFIAGMTLSALATVLLMRSLPARRAMIDDAEKAAEAAGEAIPKRDYSTATCPICGKFDPSKPFISYAIDCHRTDCIEP